MIVSLLIITCCTPTYTVTYLPCPLVLLILIRDSHLQQQQSILACNTEEMAGKCQRLLRQHNLKSKGSSLRRSGSKSNSISLNDISVSRKCTLTPLNRSNCTHASKNRRDRYDCKLVTR